MSNDEINAGGSKGALPDLEILTKGDGDKWEKLGALWKNAKVPFSGELEVNGRKVRIIAVKTRSPKPQPT